MKIKIFTLMLALGIMGTLHLKAQNSPDSDLGLGKSYSAGYIGDAVVTVDALADEGFWSALPAAKIANPVGGSAFDAGEELTESDFSATFKLAWDDDNLYVFISSTDDALVSGAGGTATDNMEFFFNTDSLYYSRDANDSEDPWRDPYRSEKNFTATQARINVLNDLDLTGGGYGINLGDNSQVMFKSIETDNGFDMEVSFPWEMIMNPAADMTFSVEKGAVVFYDMGYGDVDDDSGNRQHIVHWNATTTNGWKDVRLFTHVKLADLPEQGSVNCDNNDLGLGKSYTAGSIGDAEVTIDAIADESFWSALPEAEIANPVAGSAFDAGEDLTESDFSATFKLAWDVDNLYVFISATDDAIESGAGGTASDNLEFFFNTDSIWCARDANDSEDPWRDPYRSEKNFTATQARINVLNDIDLTGGGYGINMGDNSKVNFKSVETDNGFDMEVSFPWEMLMNPDAEMTFAPEKGAVIFYDMGYGDVDDNNSGDRQHIVHWNATTPNGWKDVRLFTHVYLGDLPETSAINSLTSDELSLYPSVTSSILNVELKSIQKYSSLRIIDICGKTHKRITNVKRLNTLQVSDLPNGLYILNVESIDGSTVSKKFIKK